MTEKYDQNMNAVRFKIVLFCGLCFFGNGQKTETPVLFQKKPHEATTLSDDNSTNLSGIEIPSESSSTIFNNAVTKETALIETTAVSPPCVSGES